MVVADFEFDADASDVIIDLDPAANPIDVPYTKAVPGSQSAPNANQH
jgi:hypothetical protein